MDESLKFVWAYVIENGKLTNGKWNYYGSDFEDVFNDYRKTEKATEEFRKKVREIGIDWNKTASPVSDMESCFDGTDHDSSRVETLLGVVILRDGSEYTIGVGNADHRFGTYITFLKNLAEDKQRVKDILGE
jgi:hypothetical protein